MGCGCTPALYGYVYTLSVSLCSYIGPAHTPAKEGSESTSLPPVHLPSTSTAHQRDGIDTPDTKTGHYRPDDEITTTAVWLDHKTPPTSSDSDISTAPEQVKEAQRPATSPVGGGGGKDKTRGGGCGVYGCDGSGVVAVVVVAAVCCAIVIVVGAVLVKKVVQERRLKKFRNVDYLINGMYT